MLGSNCLNLKTPCFPVCSRWSGCDRRGRGVLGSSRNRDVASPSRCPGDGSGRRAERAADVAQSQDQSGDPYLTGAAWLSTFLIPPSPNCTLISLCTGMTSGPKSRVCGRVMIRKSRVSFPNLSSFQLPLPPGTDFASFSRVNPPVRPFESSYSAEKITPSATVSVVVLVDGMQPTTEVMTPTRHISRNARGIFMAMCFPMIVVRSPRNVAAAFYPTPHSVEVRSCGSR